MILRTNPYRVIEGALIAAHALEAGKVVVAIKADFAVVRARLERAIAEVRAAGWADDIELTSFAGPSSYLYGEETGLLEVLDGREPFPRVAPPWRHGLDEVGDGTESTADLELAEPGGEGVAPPTLANNVETMANVAGILAEGADWFRELGTEASPGSVVCTVSGATRRHAVAEIALGTPLREVLERVGGGAEPGHEIVAVISGVANPFLPASALDTPVTYEAMPRCRERARRGRLRVPRRPRRPRRRRAGHRSLPRGGVVRPVHALQARRTRTRRSPRSHPPFRGARRRSRRGGGPGVDRCRQCALCARAPAAGRDRQRARTIPRGAARPRRTPGSRGRSVSGRADRRDRRRSGGARRRALHEAAGLDLRRDRLGQVAGAAHRRAPARNPTRTDSAKR